MWFLADGDYVNQDHVTRLEDRDDGGTLIHLVNGKTIKSSNDSSSIVVDTGIVVQAQPGFELLGLHKEKDEFCRDPIIAWRIIDGDQPIAVTPASSYNRRHSAGVGVLYPDGQIYDPHRERSHPDIKTWIQDVRKSEEEEEEKLHTEKCNAKKQALTS